MQWTSPRRIFDVTQAVVTVKSSPAADVETVQRLKSLQLGVQVGTTSYTAATSVGGNVPVEVYNTNGDAKMALNTGEIDALVADLPTAFAVANELTQRDDGRPIAECSDDVEQFGIVLDKGSPLTRCVSWAVEAFAGTARWTGWSSSGSPTRARRPCCLNRRVPVPYTSTPAWPSRQVCWSTPGGAPGPGPAGSGTPCSAQAVCEPPCSVAVDDGRRCSARRAVRRRGRQEPAAANWRGDR